MKRHVLVIPFAFLLGCGTQAGDPTPTPTPEVTGPVDLRADFPAPDANGQQFETPDLLIPALSERMYCYFMTYTGPDVGVASGAFFQSEYGHHVVVEEYTGDPSNAPDGTLIDCTDSKNEIMTEVEPLVIPTSLTPNDGDPDTANQVLDLPAGYAFSMKSGTRIVIQSHYVNTSDDDILVRDAINLGYVEPSTVTNWVAMFANLDSDFDIPAGQAAQSVVHCTWEQDANILNIIGHLHEWGTAFSIDWTHAADGTTTRLYDVPEWQPEYRDNPPIDYYTPGELQVKAGDTFTTTCSWFNSTDHDLQFPSEMCVATGIIYPSKITVMCDGGN